MVGYAKVMKMKKKLRGSAFLLLATIIWGSAFVSQSLGMDHIGPFTFQAVRCLIAVIGLIPVILLFDWKNKEHKQFFKKWADPKLWKAGILCGLPLFLACNLQQVGLVDTDAGKSGFLTAMYIVIVPVIGLLLKKKPTIMIPISVGIAVAGLYCLSCVGVTQVNPGDLLTLGCALMFAVQITLVDLLAGNMDALRLNTIQAFVCAFLSFVVVILTEQPTWAGIAACSVPLLHTGLASLIMSLEAVFAAIFGALLLKETMSFWESIGCVLVFIAVILSQIPVKKKCKG